MSKTWHKNFIRQPLTLVGFIRSIGGIKNCTEMKIRDARKAYRIVNDKNGLTLDRARQAAAEAGYLGFNVDYDMAQTTINDFLDALDSHPYYRPCDRELHLDWQYAKQKKNENDMLTECPF